MWGLESSIVETRLIRRSYGFGFNPPWDSSIHDPILDGKYLDNVDGLERASNQMFWAVQKVYPPLPSAADLCLLKLLIACVVVLQGCRVGTGGKPVERMYFRTIEDPGENAINGGQLYSQTDSLRYCESDVLPPRQGPSMYTCAIPSSFQRTHADQARNKVCMSCARSRSRFRCGKSRNLAKHVRVLATASDTSD